MKQQSQEEEHHQPFHHYPGHQITFGVCLLLFEVGVAVLYGLYGSSPQIVINISSIVITIMMILMVLVGFGLYLAYLQSLEWSALGITLMIVCVVLQLFPLINSLWSKIPIFHNPKFTDTFKIKGFQLFLANFDSHQSTGNTLTGAMRCALAVVVGSSGIIGRAIPLDFLLISITGTISFEFNRQLIANLGFDQFGSFTIFGFGGFFSFGICLIFLFLEAQKKRSKTQLVGSEASVMTSILGSLVIFLTIPVLALEGDNSMPKERFTNYTTPLSLILSMGASITTSLSLSLFVNNGTLNIRDIQNGLIAGAVVGGTTSYFITNYAFSLLCGVAAAIFQPIFQHFLQKMLRKKVGFLCTYSPSVFGFQSFLSAIFTVIFCARVNSGTTDNFNYSTSNISLTQIIISFFISLGIGIGCGLFTGFLCKIIRPVGCWLILHDKQLWCMEDGISQKSTADMSINYQYAPEIAEKMKRQMGQQEDLKTQNAGLVKTDSLGAPVPGLLKRTTSVVDFQMELDFVDMLQVPIE